MLDTTVGNHQKVNAISGTLVKSHPKSWFIRCHIRSRMSETLFSGSSEDIVLQTMLCGNEELLVEIVDKGDYQC